MRRLGAAFLFLVAAALFGYGFLHLKNLLGSAISYRLHHEVAQPLSVFLCWPILGVLCVAAGVRLWLGEYPRPFVANHGPIALLALPPILLALSLIFANEAFFSLYDPKGFPVHPPEIIAFPASGWATPAAHALAALALTVVGFLVFRASRR